MVLEYISVFLEKASDMIREPRPRGVILMII
jgi:hypothetical protein